MENKSIIQLLPDQVINKIAAGEVVERPASVMKELLENAFDAEATRVDVEVIRGGRQLIAVTDNGSGMERDQALLSIERHATSKIRSEEDIEEIHTMGFRGEALAAISSVSRFTLITRPETRQEGTAIQIAGGKMLECEPTGCPVGTRIEVRNLFFNVPARRKFLRAEQTELSHIRQLFLVHALAHPHVGMYLKVDERTLYALPAGSALVERIQAIFGAGFTETLQPIDYSTDDHTITGYAGLPQTGRKDRQDQYIFVNGRPAAAPVLYHALNEAYHPLIERGRYPAVLLFIGLAPSMVDVNVHPTKKEVRFRHPAALRDAVVAALTAALRPKRPPDSPSPSAPDTTAVPPRFETQRHMDDMLVRPEVVLPDTTSTRGAPPPSSDPVAPTSGEASAPRGPGTSPWGWNRIVGRIGDHYIVLETEDGFVLMEPRAAHERVLYEKFMGAIDHEQIERQGLLSPETVDLLPSDALIARTYIDELHALGFGISDFGADTFLIDALPIYIQDGPVDALLIEIVRELESVGSKAGTRRVARERIAQAACRIAVRAKDRLSDQELETLVADLAQTEMPYTSPRGRPTLIYTSFNELNRKFSRR